MAKSSRLFLQLAQWHLDWTIQNLDDVGVMFEQSSALFFYFVKSV